MGPRRYVSRRLLRGGDVREGFRLLLVGLARRAERKKVLLQLRPLEWLIAPSLQLSFDRANRRRMRGQPRQHLLVAPIIAAVNVASIISFYEEAVGIVVPKRNYKKPSAYAIYSWSEDALAETQNRLRHEPEAKKQRTRRSQPVD